MADDLKAKIKKRSKIYYKNKNEINPKNREHKAAHKDDIAKKKEEYQQSRHEHLFLKNTL